MVHFFLLTICSGSGRSDRDNGSARTMFSGALRDGIGRGALGPMDRDGDCSAVLEVSSSGRSDGSRLHPLTGNRSGEVCEREIRPRGRGFRRGFSVFCLSWCRKQHTVCPVLNGVLPVVVSYATHSVSRVLTQCLML